MKYLIWTCFLESYRYVLFFLLTSEPSLLMWHVNLILCFVSVLQKSSSLCRVLSGPHTSPYVFSDHAGSQSWLECRAVLRRSLHQRMRLGAEGDPGPHSLGRGDRQRGHLWGKSVLISNQNLWVLPFYITSTKNCKTSCIPFH